MRTELHFHLLPGVDDGPRTVDESLTLARLAVEDGTGTIVCTPHARDIDVLTIPDRVQRLQTELDAASIPLKLVPGTELAQDDVARLGDEELAIAAHGPADRRWVLLEAPLFLDPSGLLEAVGELTDRGYALLLGHPERCADLMAPGGGLDDLLDAGVRLQVNGSSLLGRHGDQARDWALELARDGRISVVASDAHRPTRGPILSPAVAVLVEAGVDAEAAERMVSATPHRLLTEGLPVPSFTRG